MTYVALISAIGDQRISQHNFKKHFYLDTLKFILPKSVHQSGLKTDHDVQNVSRFFSTVKEYITRLETTFYKTAMMLFYDLMKKLENGIFPSHSEVRDLNLEATKAWNFCSEKDLEEKLRCQKSDYFANHMRFCSMKSQTHSSVLSH